MIRTYDEKFIAQLKDWAVMGLNPIQIATRMNLRGDERRDFLFNICDPKGPLHQTYMEAREQHEEDIETTLVTLAINGDMDAMELQLRQEEKAEYETLLKQLFGI